MSFWTISSLRTLIFRVDRANFKSPIVHPRSLATVSAPATIENNEFMQELQKGQKFTNCMRYDTDRILEPKFFSLEVRKIKSLKQTNI